MERRQQAKTSRLGSQRFIYRCSAQRVFYKDINGTVVGPLTGIEMRAAAESGQVTHTTKVKVNSSPWVIATSIRGLFGAHDSSAHSPVAPGETTNEISPVSSMVPDTQADTRRSQTTWKDPEKQASFVSLEKNVAAAPKNVAPNPESPRQEPNAHKQPTSVNDFRPAVDSPDHAKSPSRPDDTAAVPVIPLEEDWYYVEQGERQGPVTRHDLIGILSRSQEGADTLVWKESLDDWIPARKAGIETATPSLPVSGQFPSTPIMPLVSYSNAAASLQPDGTVIYQGDYQHCINEMTQTIQALGGQITAMDPAAGKLSGTWRYGANTITVQAIFHSLSSQQIQLTVVGNVGLAVDTFGRARQKADEVVQAFLARVPQRLPSPTMMPPPRPVASHGMAYSHATFPNSTPHRGKNKTTAALLAFCLGGLGAHKFYLGAFGWGILYLLFSYTFIPAIIAFFEFLIYLTMSTDSFDAKYNYRQVNAFDW